MTTILRPDGHHLTTVKQDHHPERVKRRRQEQEKFLLDCVNGFVDDMQQSQFGSTRPNEAAIFQHYDEKWRSQCLIIEKGNEPIETNPEAFKQQIELQRKSHQKKELVMKPIHELSDADMELFDMVLIANSTFGQLWLTNRFALVRYNTGIYLHLPDITDGDRWTECLVHAVEQGLCHFHLKSAGYRMADLIMHVRTIGVNGWITPFPSEADIAMYIKSQVSHSWAAPSPMQTHLASLRLLRRVWWNPSTW